ncbi:MAG: PhoH family protein [Firmicutes bacterium]|nr:PhoH family protein [Bacillota bacterium]
MVSFVPRGNEVAIKGDAASVDKVLRVLDELAKIATEREVNLQELGYTLELAERGQEQALTELESDVIQVTCRGKKITPRTTGQRRYVQAVRENGIVFCIGPAGTGKTYLAMAMAVAELKAKRVGRIILTRPAVEAGERLGFLPGDLQDKVDPYLRPLYDALYDILGAEIYEKYSEKGIIEVAPLAYMRGRTLDDSFIILDEAQNTTPEQMKMFLTRMGFGSKMIITGDITQVDLPRDKSSGLQQVQGILRDVEGIEFVYLDNRDVVRHELVQRIIKAYDLFEQKQVVAEKDGVINNGVVEEV